MEVVFAEPVDPTRFADVPGVRVLSVENERTRFRFGVQDNLPALLRRLAELPIVDLTYAPPDLESVFLTYYQAEQSERQEAAS